jgi:glucosamine--fructose-6-phosphate aminotransferase (isomerizing)
MLIRALGRIGNLEEKMEGVDLPPNGTRCGIGHTRWATHGRPSETNAHPHSDCSGQFIVAHNGIVENYVELKRRLMEQGHQFKTETDTEVLPHLVESYFRGNLEHAVRAAMMDVEGVYGIVVISTHDSEKIVAARKGPPIVIGVGEGENFIASDAPALLPYTREMIFLKDHEVAVVRRDSLELSDLEGRNTSRPAERIDWSAEMAEKEGYPHFMLKEIFEQPDAIRKTLSVRVGTGSAFQLNELSSIPRLSSVKRMVIVACGTSYYAALIAY